MEERVEVTAKRTCQEVPELMDTPERNKTNQITASVSKFEDSPVFNFLNSLSPIKPVKSTHISQTINPLSFASIPSVFTSPHVSSLRGSRFLRRHQLSDPSKPEFSSEDGIKVDTSTTNNATMQLDEQNESADGEVAAESSYDCTKFVVDFDKDYECASPKFNLRPGCGLEAKGRVDYSCSSSALVHEPSQRGDVNMDVANQIDQNKGGTSCDWEHMISDTSDLLVLESPNDRDFYSNSVNPESIFFTRIKGDMQSMHLICAVESGEQNVTGNEADLSIQPGEENDMDNASGSSLSNPDEKVDYEHLGFYRGMRRRCLVFEMGGGRRKLLDDNSNSDSSVWLHSSDGNMPCNDQKKVSISSRGNESSRCLLPGIGLHLNALATTPKDHKNVDPDSSASARLLIGPSSVINIHPSTNDQGLLDTVLPVTPSDREIVGMENTVLPVEDDCLPSGYTVSEGINQSSPQRKRRRAEQAGEGESCKQCNCKRSKCLKLYCECFAAGVYCVEPCACMDCFNKPIHEDTVLATRKQIESRNPLAFAPKVIRGSDSPLEIGQDDASKTPASARHKRGCNCKKSSCLKKYCECFQGGVGCSVNCRCEGCKNAFGRKDGVEAEIEEEETDASEKSMLDKCFQKSATENEVEQDTDSAPPATPLRGGRPSARLPFSSKKKPPRSSFPSIAVAATSSSFLPRQGLGTSSLFPPPPPPPTPKFDKQFETIIEDEIPEFLQGGSPDGGSIKLSSPNLKRVSPPHNANMSPGLRSSRKLILQSIPLFPSLSQNQ